MCGISLASQIDCKKNVIDDDDDNGDDDDDGDDGESPAHGGQWRGNLDQKEPPPLGSGCGILQINFGHYPRSVHK